ncbi:MAG: hypothetical protein IT379_13305 [Deltaproteobacteria bacterium]|nr:hypothetical protein [Deltaproteobacteria bacterium]
MSTSVAAHRRRTFAICAFAWIALAGCEDAATGVCGAGGTLVTAADASRYCVYSGLSPERGGRLTCPPELTFKLQTGTIVVCAERPASVADLPPEVCAELDVPDCGRSPDGGTTDAGTDSDTPDAGPAPIDSGDDSGSATDAGREMGATDAGADTGPRIDAGPLVPGCEGRAICAIAAGRGHSCALFASGHVRCWGRGAEGQIGSGGTDREYRTPMPVGDLVDAIAITAGWYHTCALRIGGEVACWGLGEHGQLGVGDFETRTRPETITGLSGVAQVVAGARHTCARSGESIRCWGNGENGRLGNDATTSSPTPVMVTGAIAGARWVAPGDRHTCAAEADGSAVCWGSGGFGTLGDGSGFDSESPTPVSVLGLAGVVAMSSADATCALTEGAPMGVSCWGSNASGQIGMTPGGYADIARSVAIGAGSPVSIAARGERACVVLDSGGLVCWGAPPRGDGDAMDTGIPTAVPSITNAVQVALGFEHACVLTRRDEVLCWGGNAYGELGTGPSDTSPFGHDTPVVVVDLL